MKIPQKVDEIISSTKQTIEIKGIPFNFHDTVKRINKYVNNQYWERQDDAIFWNIINPRIVHFSKNLEFDTKDLMPYAIGEINSFQSWVLRKMVRKWFNDTHFYLTINDTAENEATYGSIILKKCKEKGETELENVDLCRMHFDQRAKCIRDVDKVELHELDEREVKEKEGIWENTDKLLDIIKKEKHPAEVWEFWGYDDEDGNFKQVIGYGKGDEYIKLWEMAADEDEDPYYDVHLGAWRGRWMRVGVAERLFELQAQANKLVNQNSQSRDIASLLLFKTSNSETTGNVLEQAINGQIINDPELQQIGVTNTGLNEFIAELNQIEAQADKLCLTPEFITGETTPSGTPFRSLATLTNAAKNAFKVYKENLGETLGNILITEIFPEIVKKWNGKKTVLEIAEDESDIEMYDRALETAMAIDMMLSGSLVDKATLAEIKTLIQEQIKFTGRKVELPKKFFDFEWGFKMMPTSETIDKTQQNDAYFNALQMIQSNPNLNNVPLFKQYLENNGISWWKLTPEQITGLIQSQQTAGQPIAKAPEDALMKQVNTM